MRRATSRCAKIFLPLVIAAAVCAPRAAAAGDKARVVFVGDVMAHAEQLDAARRDGGWSFFPQFRRIIPLFYGALVVGNLETVFAGEGRGYAGYPMFNTPDELAGDMASAGFDAVTLANNHILDRRESGAKRTTEVLDAAGILWTGLADSPDMAGEPLIVEYGGLKWAFLNYSYGSNNPPSGAASPDIYMNTISDEAVEEGLARARESEADVIVACFHWGIEYQLAPTKRTRQLAELCAENGAHMVIGTHPHVLQPIEVISSDRGRALVAYSLGNFVSNQRTLPRERSVVLAVDVEKKPGGGAAISRVSVAPTWVSSTRQSGRRRFQIVYGGTGGPFNHEGLSPAELGKARSAGSAVLDFLGAESDPDGMGFYALWDATSPDVLPESRRKSPE